MCAAEVVRGADWVEALFFIEPQRALVAGDLLIGTEGGVELPVRWFPAGEQEWAERELKLDLRERLAAFPIELVVVPHGEPVPKDAKAALGRALA